jgi:hypothetical protein
VGSKGPGDEERVLILLEQEDGDHPDAVQDKEGHHHLETPPWVETSIYFLRYGRQAAYEAWHGYSSKLFRPKSSLLTDQLSEWSGKQLAELFQINLAVNQQPK